MKTRSFYTLLEELDAVGAAKAVAEQRQRELGGKIEIVSVDAGGFTLARDDRNEIAQELQAERQLRHEAEHELVMAKALAALVTLELANLLTLLAGVADLRWQDTSTDEDVRDARALAARIREVLEEPSD